VHKIGHDKLKTTKELLDITTHHASGEEAIEVVFVQGNGKMVPGGSRGAPPKVIGKGANKVPKGAERGKSGAPIGSQLLPAAMMTTTRKWTIPMRSMSQPPSVTSSTRRGSRLSTSRNFSMQPVRTMHTPSNISSKSAP
jgi:hypothetical protein